MNSILATLRSATAATPLRREMPIKPKVLDAAKGIIRFTASDETMDYSNEIVRLSGWRFTNFAKNAPFVDSHDYSEVSKILGQVISYGVVGAELVEDVQFALTPGGQTLADWAFAMYRDEFLRACSVGFVPLRYATKWDSDRNLLVAQISDLKLDAASAARLNVVYVEQEQIELSGCILGCNPNALAKAYKAGTLSDESLEKFATMYASTKTTKPAADSADAGEVLPRTKLALLAAIQARL